MYSFIKRPIPPTVEVKVEFLESKKNELEVLIKVKADLTQIKSATEIHSTMLSEDLHFLLVNHVNMKIRKNLKAFAGKVVYTETFAASSKMKIYFSDDEKKDNWIKYVKESEQLNVETLKKDCDTALQEIWQWVLCRISGTKLFEALREKLKGLREGTDF